MLEDLKMEIKEVKKMIQSSSSLNLPKLPEDCPKFPIDSPENMQKFEIYLHAEKNFLSVVS